MATRRTIILICTCLLGVWGAGQVLGQTPNTPPPQKGTGQVPSAAPPVPSSPLTPPVFPGRTAGGKNPDPFFDPSYPERTRADGWPIYSDRLERWQKLRAERIKKGQGTEIQWRYLTSELKIVAIIVHGGNVTALLSSEPDKESFSLKVGAQLFDGTIREIGFERQDRNGLIVKIPFVAYEIREPKGAKRFRIVVYGN